MAFTIPNEVDAFVTDQAEPDSVDFGILTAAHARNAVTSGCAVTAQATPDMTVAVASGEVIVAGVPATVTAGNVTITAANGTSPRFDLIVANSSGTKSAVAGTASSNPVFPAIPAASVVLAAVYVAAAVTTIVTNRITDKRISIVNVFTSPTIVTPTIAATGWTNATHTHAGTTTGGQVDAGNLTGATLAAGVTASSLTSLGTLTGLTVNSATITLSQDTNFVLSGGVNGISFDTTVLSIDATNNRVGIGTATPRSPLHAITVANSEYVLVQGTNGGGGTALTTTDTIPIVSGIGFSGYNGLAVITNRWGNAGTVDAHQAVYIGGSQRNVDAVVAGVAFANWGYFTGTGSAAGELGNTTAQGDAVKFELALLDGGSAFVQRLSFRARVSSGVSTEVFVIQNSGLILIGDIANANMTFGLTINQSTHDNQLFAGKSTDVAHALTSGGSVAAETDDYVSMQKFSATLGGLLLASFQEDPAGAQVAMAIDAFGGQAATGPSTTNENLFIIRAAEHNAANALIDAPANSQIFGIQRRVSGAWNNAFIVDEDGDLFVDGNITTTAFDSWDDVALVRAFDQSRSDQLIRSRWDDYVYYNQADLQRAGIISTPTDAGRAMVNVTQLQRLHNGAIWQLGTKAMSHEERIEHLEQDNKALRQELLVLREG